MRISPLFILIFLFIPCTIVWADALSDLVEKKQQEKATKEKSPVKLKAYDDEMAQFLIEQGIVTNVVLQEPTDLEKAKFKAEYEKSIKKLLVKGAPVYLNTELDSSASVFSKPGFDDEDCTKKNSCQIAAELQPDSDIHSVGEVYLRETLDEYKTPDYTGYVKVRYQVRVNGKLEDKQGWVLADSLSSRLLKALYEKVKPAPAAPEVKKADCIVKTPIEKNRDDLKDLSGAIQKHERELEAKYAQVNPLVGQCLISKPKEPVSFTSKLLYDEKILPVVAKAAAKSVNPSPQQIIQIDAVARTLYAEMGRCYSKGLQYPMAVGRIILNRQEYEDKHHNGLYIKNPSAHSAIKTTSAQVVTDASQFSAWRDWSKSKKNTSSMQLMCPPSGQKDFYWNASQVPKHEAATWEQSVRIATEMTLYPEEFKERTESLKGIHLYTSGASRIPCVKDSNKIGVSVEQRPVNLSSCLNIFKDPPAQEVAECVKKRKAKR